MKLSDIHTHTVFSDGTESAEEMVRAAMQMGFGAIGISDHSYTAHDLRYCIPRAHQQAYLAELARLKAKYADRIEVYIGLEYDGTTELADRDRYDYVIGDCHYVKTFDGYHSVDHAREEQRAAIETYFDGNTLAYAQAYFETYLACTRLHRPDVLGHFDLAAKFGYPDETDARYRSIAAETLLECLKVTPIVELNTGAISRKIRTVPYPREFLLREILLHGGKITLSSDAHRSMHIGFGFHDALELLRHIGFSEIVVLQGGAFREVGI